MLWLTITVALLLALLAIGFVVWPLWQAGTPVHAVDDSPMTELIQRKDAVLGSIKELEFDYQTGKLSVEDYTRLDQRLRQQAINLLRQLEKAAPETATLEAELEAAILHQRQTSDRIAGDQEPERISASISAGNPRFCPQCGSSVVATANFCASCGAALRKVGITATMVE